MRLSVLQRNQFEQSVCGIAAAGHTIGVFRWFTGLKYDYNSLLSPKSSCRACIFRTATTALRWNIAHVRAYTRFTDNIHSDGWHFRHSTRDSPRAHWPAAAASAEKREALGTGCHGIPLCHRRTLRAIARSRALRPSFDFLRIFSIRPFVRFSKERFLVPSYDFFTLLGGLLLFSYSVKHFHFIYSTLWIPPLIPVRDTRTPILRDLRYQPTSTH